MNRIAIQTNRVGCSGGSAHACSTKRGRKPGFTLVELLVSISIITLLASMILVALSGVQENAKADRTRAQVARIDTLISEQWDSYGERRLALTASFKQSLRVGPPGVRATAGPRIARARLDRMRELMRLELPDRKSDVLTPPVGFPSSKQRAYQRKAAKLISQRTGMTFPVDDAGRIAELDRQWTRVYDYAECLYLILSQINEDDTPALSFFADNEIGDADGDGMPEIRDSWGTPIMFLRWAPGFSRTPSDTMMDLTTPQLSGVAGGPQVRPGLEDPGQPDPLDPFNLSGKIFKLYPLVVSAGPDLQFDIGTDNQDGNALIYANTLPPNNPYIGWDPNDPLDVADNVKMVGSFLDGNNDGRDNSLDNVTNHNLVAN